MKLNKKFVAVVMTVAVALAMTPAVVFADTGAVPVTLKVNANATYETAPDRGNGAVYNTIAEAVNASESGDTIEMESDVDVPAMITLSKSITLKLNGNTAQRTGENIKTIKTLVQVIDEATLTIDGTKTGSAVNGNLYAGIAKNNNGHIVINGGTYTPTVNDDCEIQSNGSCSGCSIKASNATFTSGDDTFYLAGGGTYELTNCIVNGYTGIYVKAGSLTVSNTKITATGDYADAVAKGNGANSTGDGIILDSKVNYFGNINLKLNSGNDITSTNGYALRETYTDATTTATHSIDITGGKYTGNTGRTAYSVSGYFKNAVTAGTSSFTITGGTFSSDPSQYVASGYVVSQSGSSYIVSPYVAPKTDTTTTTGSDGTVESTTTTTPDVTTSENGDVAATVDNTEGDKMVKNVKEAEAAAAKDGKTIDTNVVVSGSGSQDAGQVSVSLPASTISGLANETNATVTLETPVGNVTLDQKALDAIAAKSGDTGTVTLIIVNVDKDTLSASLQKSLGSNVKVIDLKLVTSSGNVTDFNGGTATVETSVPDGIAAKDAACIYLDDNNVAYNVSGKVFAKNGKNMFRFTTGHNSHYAIVSKASASSLTKGYAPTGVKAKVTGNKSIKVTWKKFSGATSYRVYKATKKSGKYTYVGKTTGTSLTAKGLKAKTKYYFKVKAMSGENYKTSRIVSAKTPSANGFLSFTLTNISGNNVKVHWKAVKGAAKYQIAYDSPGNKTLKTRWTGTNSKNTYTSINRAKGQTYKYKMRYYKIKNGKKVYSDWTEVQSITVK